MGKSALTIQFIQGKFIEEYDPTIEDSYRKQCAVDGESALLDILDTAGQEEYAAMREQYIRAGQGFLLVYAINNGASFEEMQQFVPQINRAKQSSNVPIILVGNKCDLEEFREVSFATGKEYAIKNNMKFLECSAQTGLNVQEAFFDTVRAIRDIDGKTPKSKTKKTKKCIIL